MSDKYCVFKTEDLYTMMVEVVKSALTPLVDKVENKYETKAYWVSLAEHITKQIEETRLKDIKIVHKDAVNVMVEE